MNVYKGEWTELPIQELDQIFGGRRWMGNGYAFDLLGPKFVYSRVVDRWDENAPKPDGGEWFYTDSSWGEKGWRKKWINGKHIFDMKLGYGLPFGHYIYFRDLEGQVWERKVNLGIRFVSKANFGLSGDGYQFKKI